MLLCVAAEDLHGAFGVVLESYLGHAVRGVGDGFGADRPPIAAGSRLLGRRERAVAALEAEVAVAEGDVPAAVSGVLQLHLLGLCVGTGNGEAVDGDGGALSAADAALLGHAGEGHARGVGLFVDEQIGGVGRERAVVEDALVVAVARGAQGFLFAVEAGKREADCAVALANVVDFLVEQLGAVEVFVVERGGGSAVVAEAVVGAIGIGIGAHAFEGVSLVAARAVALVGSVGRNPCHALVLGRVVGVVLRPRRGLVVDVQDEQSVAGHAAIPAHVLAVLEQEVLVGVGVVVHDVGIAAFLQRLHALDADGVGELDGLEPSHHPALVGGVAGGQVAVAVVGTGIHQVPVGHALAAGVVGVVEVGIAQAVAELVAHGADAVDVARQAFQFAAAGVGVDAHAVERERRARGRPQVPGVGPDGIVSTAVGLALAGIDDIHLINLAVAVPVVFRIVDIDIGQLAGLTRHLARTHVVALIVVAAVVRLRVGHRHGAYDVELQFELPHALGVEVVVHRPLEIAFVEVLFVGNALVEGLAVAALETDVAEVHKDDQAALLAEVVAVAAHLAALQTLGTLLVDGLAAHLGVGLQPLHVGKAEHAGPFRRHQRTTVAGQPVVAVLVAHQLGFHLRSVAQREHTFQSGLGRNGISSYSHHHRH